MLKIKILKENEGIDKYLSLMNDFDPRDGNFLIIEVLLVYHHNQP